MPTLQRLLAAGLLVNGPSVPQIEFIAWAMEWLADKVRAAEILKAQVRRLTAAAQQAQPPAAGREQKAPETADSGQKVLEGSAGQQGLAAQCLRWIRESWTSWRVWGLPPLPGGSSSKHLLPATALGQRLF